MTDISKKERKLRKAYARALWKSGFHKSVYKEDAVIDGLLNDDDNIETFALFYPSQSMFAYFLKRIKRNMRKSLDKFDFEYDKSKFKKPVWGDNIKDHYQTFTKAVEN